MMQWFRVYTEILHDEKIDAMNSDTFTFFIKLLALTKANETDGKISKNLKYLSENLKFSIKKTEKCIKNLQDLQIIFENSDGFCFINWDKRQYKSDDINARVKDFRARNKEPKQKDETLHSSESETLHSKKSVTTQTREEQTREEQNRTESSCDDDSFNGNRDLIKLYIRLNKRPSGSPNDITEEKKLRARPDFDEVKAINALTQCHINAQNSDSGFRASSLSYYVPAIERALEGKTCEAKKEKRPGNFMNQ